jgi:A/G-specific adenine glycosylase
VVPGRAHVQAAVLAWGEAHRRDLPWRRTRDPWAVLVSELMLQQTQVARVVPRFGRFLHRFPTAAAGAAAGAGAVVEEWAGLGYNRRAVNLHRAAVAVVERHGGRLPRDLAALLALPGVGPYTARAVLAFAFGDDVGVVEVNTARVLARAFAGRRLGPAEAQRLADGLVPAGEGWAWNQALIDLGATVCGKSDARCSGCPLVQACAWAAGGCDAPDPAMGSAGAGSRQSTFAGSDRQGRGRLVDALRAGPVAPADVAACAGWPSNPARAQRVARGLVADGLAVVDGSGALRLP